MRAGWDPRVTKEWWQRICRRSSGARRNSMEIFRKPLTAAEIKGKARELGADLVGIADGARVDTSHITVLDAGRVIVLAKRLNDGVARIQRWDDRHKYYNDELALTHLEETSAALVLSLRPARKDRFASEISVGLSVHVKEGSTLELYPYDELETNPFNTTVQLR